MMRKNIIKNDMYDIAFLLFIKKFLIFSFLVLEFIIVISSSISNHITKHEL